MLNEKQLAEAVTNSYKNFHTKGLDYICLSRSLTLTRKVYFFDGDVSKLPEVVNPHDHRYDFRTTVLRGHMSNSHYLPVVDGGDMYNMFEWRTPLNGGDGFTFRQEMRLNEIQRTLYGDSHRQMDYYMQAHEFHTIRMHSDQCVLLLEQFSDVVPLDKPTLTFMKEKQPPSLDGLYERFTEDEILKRLDTIKHLLWEQGRGGRI